MTMITIANFLRTESEVVTPTVLTEQYGKASVWDFPVTTKRSQLLSCLLYGTNNNIPFALFLQARNRPMGITGE